MDIRYKKYHGLDNKTPWITYIFLRLWHGSFHHLPYAPVKTAARLNSLSSTLILQSTKLVQVDKWMFKWLFYLISTCILTNHTWQPHVTEHIGDVIIQSKAAPTTLLCVWKRTNMHLCTYMCVMCVYLYIQIQMQKNSTLWELHTHIIYK